MKTVKSARANNYCTKQKRRTSTRLRIACLAKRMSYLFQFSE